MCGPDINEQIFCSFYSFDILPCADCRDELSGFLDLYRQRFMVSILIYVEACTSTYQEVLA